MSTTTQILFNSPALHSLKRDQLLKLCKIHSLKASGKNIELIDRLKKHADALPKDAPLSIAVIGEGATGAPLTGNQPEEMNKAMNEEAQPGEDQSTYASGFLQNPRPSEKWEVVMESIEETMEEGSSKGTLTSLRTVGNNTGGSGEFGTVMPNSSSITSSIKTLASSLGLKRGNSSTTLMSSLSSTSSLYLSSKGDELSKRSMPYSSLAATEAPPQTDHFTFDHPIQSAEESLEPQAPLPGHSLRPGVPAPENARLSLGLNPPSTPTRSDLPTTTIRLISKPPTGAAYGGTPMLKPFKTAFDLVLGSPQALGGFRGTTLWPNDGTQGIYPPLPFDELMRPSVLTASQQDTIPSITSFPPPPPLANPTPVVTAPVSGVPESDLPNPWPRPLPEPPNTAAYLALPKPFVFGSSLPQHNVSNEQFKAAAASVLDEMNKRLSAQGVDGVGMDLISDLQPGAHAFGVLDRALGGPETQRSADGFYNEKFQKLHEEEFNKMEGIDGLVKRRGGMNPRKGTGASIGKRKSSASGHGAGRDRFGRRVSGNVGRVSMTRVISNGRRPRVLPGGFADDYDSASEAEEDGPAGSGGNNDRCVEKKEGEAKAKAEDERKKREKEAIRRKLELNKARRSSSATRGRVSVGRGGVLVKPEPRPKPSRFGFLSTAKSLVQNVWNRGKSKPTVAPAASTPSSSNMPKLAAKQQKSVPPAVSSTKVPPTRTSSVAGPSRVSSVRAEKDKDNLKGTVPPSSVRARSPLPSFAPPSSSRSSLMKPGRTGSIIGTGTLSKSGGSQSGASSIGTRTSFSSANSKTLSLGVITSLGGKKLPTTGQISSATAVGSSSSSSRLSSSRLLAPTASSLAKTARPSASGSGIKSTRTYSGEMNVTMNGSKTSVRSPRPEKIFSKPLGMMPPSETPTSVKRGPQSSVFSSAQPDSTTQTKDAGSEGSIRQRSLNGRKPRISRSRVIAKLASQRAAGISGAGSRDISNTRRISAKVSGTPGRKRSSLGVKAQRSSFAGGMMGGVGNDAVLMSAKKRVRQSEYARRRSRVQAIDFGKGGKEDGMDVDND